MSVSSNKPDLVLSKKTEDLLYSLLPDSYVSQKENRPVNLLKDIIKRLNDVENRLAALEP